MEVVHEVCKTYVFKRNQIYVPYNYIFYVDKNVIYIYIYIVYVCKECAHFSKFVNSKEMLMTYLE